MEITGRIHLIYDTQTIKDTFRKREFILNYISDNPDYPQYLKFEFIQDNCSMLDNFSVGDEVKVSFDLRGRKWINPKQEEVYFNTLQAWRIVKISDAEEHPADKDVDSDIPLTEDDDLPF
ncbi:MAG: DUF3127 domain-containing protein [Ignavibacteriaceae bacterium]|jgi:Protein of unknown function (DUF3127).|nr:MAG: DUF3127 domain-containing protein [Chlorobiota bacterium]KXK01766.1 MAG: hypothetical protein UZ04_CHB001002151 [Chlorobi bacterium OLB4]MBV6399018.1 hypothetical protein [Ignavibacteria bacterium]MCC6885953.1 DUF3127 domain-containing protein [Ignavibacteriales bacterium]MCE7953390.1 DUF3127 domain-containing protein [Chlorobi bacterium CHB7]MDL1887326.1 DUF3127 domain-containing protein [Ignavibacteria bacterium CHB1]MEB2330622.1 DUF3127 domain-containing protein [Ignavibacteriaceae